jgi:glycosyltransferase involved in cell wall biosynthesis
MPMRDARSPSASADREEADAASRTLLVSAVLGDADASGQLGKEAYSYQFVYRAFLPLLQRLGAVVQIDRPESRLDFAVRRARLNNCEPLHLSFRPLQQTYIGRLAPNVVFPFWEFPDIPDEDLEGNPRNNWRRIGASVDCILCASEFTRAAFRRAGVRTPAHVVPVPVREQYFAAPVGALTDGTPLECAVHLLTAGSRASKPRAASKAIEYGQHAQVVVHAATQELLRATLPAWLDRRVGLLGRRVRTRWQALQSEIRAPAPSAYRLAPTGVVYTSVVNPFDRRKNWQDLLSAFLIGLRDQEDAVLILKLVLPSQLQTAGLRQLLEDYYRFDIEHRCTLAIVPGYLTDEQMTQLARLSTYYVTATRAEGACLPVQEFLAAGRPVIGPRHTALADYLDPDVAFIVESQPEPTWWPIDRSRRLRTTWHRLGWQSLHDRLQESYDVAKHDRGRYEHLALAGRARMLDFASAAQVWPRLQTALADVGHATATLR